MKLGWPVWGGRAARRARPRVVEAIRAARIAESQESYQAPQMAWASRLWGAGSPGAGDGSAPPLVRYTVQRRRVGAGLSPALVRATAQAARARGRQPAEVWAEALRNWLVGDELAADHPVLIPPDPRRARAWQAIDSTLGELRAS